MIQTARASTQSRVQSSWLLILILCVASFLRLYQLGHEGLWVDEMNSIHDAQKYWQSPTVRRPLYYILLSGWLQFGQSDLWLRGLSVLFGVGCVWLIYRLAAQLFNQHTGLVAALMIALSPLFINHSQEIRMYSLSSFLSLLGSVCFLNALNRPAASNFPPGKPHRLSLIGWALSRLLAVLTTPLNIVLLLPDALLCSYYWWRRPRQYSLFWLGGLFVCAGALPTLLAQTVGGAAQDFFSSQVADYSKPGLLQVIGMVTQFAALWPLRYFLEEQFQDNLAKNELGDASLLGHFLTHLSGSLVLYAAVVLVLLCVLGFGLAHVFSRQRAGFAAIAAWAFIPSAAILLLSYVSGSLWFPRYLLGFAPYFVILLAAGFVQLYQQASKWRWVSGLVGAVYIAGVGTGLKGYYGTDAYRNDWKTVNEVVTSLEQPGDAIVYYAPPRYQPYSFPRYYSGDNNIALLSRPPDAAILEVDHIRQNLSEDLPTGSRLIVVCWWFCSDQAAMSHISDVIAQENVVLEQKIQVESLGKYPIEVHLFSPSLQIPSTKL